MLRLQALRAFNYLYFSLMAIFISFLPTYMDAQGASPSEIGLVMGSGGIIGIFAQPFWGVVSDRMKTIKRVILVLLLTSMLVGYLLFQLENILYLMLFTGLMYMFLMPIDPLIESLNFQSAERMKVSYGTVRTFGAIGYAVTSLIAGQVMHQFGASSLAMLFVGMGAVALIACTFVLDAPVSNKPVSLASLRAFFSYRETIWFFILVFLTALPQRMNDNYLGVYIKSLGGTDDVVGLAWFLSGASETVVFALSFWWLRKKKEMLLISIATIFYMIRFGASIYIDDPQHMAYVQVLHSVTFPVFYSASIQYLYRIVPEEWRATGQTALAIVFFGISGIVSSFLGGWVFEAFGGDGLYGFMSALSAAALLLGISLRKVIKS